MAKLKSFYILLAWLAAAPAGAQAQQQYQSKLDGEVVIAYITPDNDTMLIKDLADLNVSSPRSFDNKEDYRRYRKYRKYAAVVYPYAVEAIKVFKEIREETDGLKKRKRKKHAKKVHKELKTKFHDPIKNLTKTQGFLLIEMVEKETGMALYDLIKDYRGGLNAFSWNFVGNLNGFKIKEVYQRGQDPILDMVLDDYDLSPEN